MKYAQHLDHTFILGEEQDAVVAHAKAKFLSRGPELFHVACSYVQVAVDGLQNL